MVNQHLSRLFNGLVSTFPKDVPTLLPLSESNTTMENSSPFHPTFPILPPMVVNASRGWILP